MNETFRHETRPGNLPLSLFTLAGLVLLAVQLWEIMPGYVMLIFVPALMVCIVQLVLTPVYRLQISNDAWRLEAGAEMRVLPVDRIAFLRIEDRLAPTRGAVVLADGSEVELPAHALPDPLVLIREATRRGIPVRHV